MNVYDDVTQICSYNYTYYFKLTFEKISLHQLCSCNYTSCLELSFINLAAFAVNKTDLRFLFTDGDFFLLPGLILTETEK